MSLYTTTLEMIVNNKCADNTANIQEKIESARSYIFDFEYPIPQHQIYTDDFKAYFEKSFINEYLFENIASETVARFKQRLYTRCLKVFPRYKVIFDILNSIDYKNILTDFSTNKNETRQHENNENNTSSVTGSGTVTGKAGEKSASAFLPEELLASGKIGNFTDVGFANNSDIKRMDSEDTTNTTTESTINNNSTGNERYISTSQGRAKNQIEILRLVDEDFNKYFENLINEFSDLFMKIYY